MGGSPKQKRTQTAAAAFTKVSRTHFRQMQTTLWYSVLDPIFSTVAIHRCVRGLNRNMLTALTALLALVSVSTLSSQESRSFTNGNSILIADETSATPYPSTINVSGFTGEVSRVTVTFRGLEHSYPDDMDVLLVGPTGVKTMVMSDAGGSFPVNGVTFILDDTAVRTLPNSMQLTSGSYTPANWGSQAGDDFPAPAPQPPYTVALSSFNGTRPNGVWSLYISDDIPENSGELANGWSLTVQTAPVPPPRMSITRTNSDVSLAWPTNAPGFTLERRAALSSEFPWTAVTNAVVVTNGQFRVTLPIDSFQSYFRLRK